ncbi:MAG: hypothetical protein M5U34_49045 [Chloroflexi bacterium]|nr:hypothetical protein [Chloroflexota bacterium]
MWLVVVACGLWERDEMTLRCKNCDQTILPSDVVCWHCGYELAPIEMAAGEQPNEPPLSEEPDMPGVSLIWRFLLCAF